MNREAEQATSSHWVLVEGFLPSTSLNQAKDTFKFEKEILSVEPRPKNGQFLLWILKKGPLSGFLKSLRLKYFPRDLQFTELREEFFNRKKTSQNSLPLYSSHSLDQLLIIMTFPLMMEEKNCLQYIENIFGKTRLVSVLPILYTNWVCSIDQNIRQAKSIQIELFLESKEKYAQLVALKALPDQTPIIVQLFGPRVSLERRSEPLVRYYREDWLHGEALSNSKMFVQNSKRSSKEARAKSPFFDFNQLSKYSRLDINASSHVLKPTTRKYFRLRPRQHLLPSKSCFCFRLSDRHLFE